MEREVGRAVRKGNCGMNRPSSAKPNSLQQGVAGILAVVLFVFYSGFAVAQTVTPPSHRQAVAASAKFQLVGASSSTSKISGANEDALVGLPSNPVPPVQSTPAPQQQQTTSQQPLGTAAAPYIKTTGNAASRPAGAAIAPGKQKRARYLLIKVGLLVGAAVAVGTVIGLSKASSSRPN